MMRCIMLITPSPEAWLLLNSFERTWATSGLGLGLCRSIWNDHLKNGKGHDLESTTRFGWWLTEHRKVLIVWIYGLVTCLICIYLCRPPDRKPIQQRASTNHSSILYTRGRLALLGRQFLGTFGRTIVGIVSNNWVGHFLKGNIWQTYWRHF